jgi:hypothetical protein
MVRLQKATHYALDIDSTSKEVVAANAQRKFLTIVNSSDVGVWLGFGQAAVVGQGAYLAAGGGVYNITSENLWVGSIHAITASGDNKVGGAIEFL